MLNPRLLVALSYLSREERIRLASGAKRAQSVETEWILKFESYIRKLDDEVFTSLYTNGEFSKKDVDFLPLVLEHSFKVMREAIEDAENGKRDFQIPVRFGAKRNTIPRTLKDLKEMWDLWRRKRDIPPRQKVMAEKIKKAYLDRVQKVWDKYGEDFRKGKEFSPAAVQEILREKGDMGRSRATTIVRTESTFYWNKATVNFYEKAPDVTHMLFLAIRDRATTKICRSRQGIVFKVGTQLFKDNTPGCHWNCRSQYLPLSTANPKHRKLIEDKSRMAERVKLEPLPRGWTARA